MLRYQLSKHAFKTLSKIEKSDGKLANRILQKIEQLSRGEITGEALQGAKDCSKVRVGKYRIISTVQEDILLIFIIEKRETVYKTFQHLFKNL